MKKIVRVKCKSLCPLSNEGVHSQLNESQDMLDTLNKFEEGEAKKAESRHLYLQKVFTTYQTERSLTHSLLRYSKFCVIVSSV